MLGKKKLGPVGSAVFTLIEYKQTSKDYNLQMCSIFSISYTLNTILSLYNNIPYFPPPFQFFFVAPKLPKAFTPTPFLFGGYGGGGIDQTISINFYWASIHSVFLDGY